MTKTALQQIGLLEDGEVMGLPELRSAFGQLRYKLADEYPAEFSTRRLIHRAVHEGWLKPTSKGRFVVRLKQ